MPTVTVIYGEIIKSIGVEKGCVLGDAISKTGLPLEQPCAGRGTCGKCKVLLEEGLTPPDAIEKENLTEGELIIGNRLACRAKVFQDMKVILSPIVVYSNKSFRSNNRYKQAMDVPLGLSIDLGTTTVAAFLTMMDDGEVCLGAASLNQQTIFGADVISRMDNAKKGDNVERIYKLALSSINQSIDGLKLSRRIRKRIQRVVIVGNVVMHHLVTRKPVDSLMVYPFQPVDTSSIIDGNSIMGGIFPRSVEVWFPPLIGGFVGSDALSCLAYFNFDNPTGPIAAIDLGTNGEVMVTDGNRILTASTAAGPAFEGVQISCGSRAIDGAVVGVRILDTGVELDTIGGAAPIGLTGSGLLSVVHELLKVGLIDEGGKISTDNTSSFYDLIGKDKNGIRYIRLTSDGTLRLTQWDIRELQKAKGAILAAINILLEELDLVPADLQKIYLTGSFGGQVDIDAAIAIGMIPEVNKSKIESIANGAGLGASLFLSPEGFTRGEKIAEKAEQLDLDVNLDFQEQYVNALVLRKRV